MKYQVKDWATHFENDRSKTRDQCRFVCVPNKQHGMGFSYVMAEPDGALIYGIWGLILGACSQQKRPRQGWLTSDGTQNGEAWTPENLAVKFRRPVAEIKRAIDALSSPKIDWLTVHSPSGHHAVTVHSPSTPREPQDTDNKDLPPTHRPLTADSPSTHLEGKGREGNRREVEGNGRDGKHKCSVDELKAYCITLSLPESDGEATFAKWEGNGWTNSGKKIVDWKATVRSWKLHGYLPSQKQSGNQTAKPESPQW